MPPGPPAPLMKTLDQVEPRIPIDGTHTPPGASDELFRISAGGSYYLTANLNGVSGKNGIVIAASGVTLDLNGFDVAGVTGSGSGIKSLASLENIRVCNGRVRN